MAYEVAVVDDDSLELTAVRGILKESNISVVPLNSGRALLTYLRVREPDLILLDIMMPEMDGLQTMKELRKLESELGREASPVIFLTGKDSGEGETESVGLKMGAMDFIRKPFNPEALTLRVRNTIELVKLQRQLESAVEEKVEENRRLALSVVSTLAETIEAKDEYTRGHSRRVAEYSREIARRYGYNKKQQENIYMMGILHDVGKIGVPDTIITKNGKLTDEEYAQMKQHPAIGHRILSTIKERPDLATGARWHHERYDGKGYPDGISGTDIPEQARIIAVADAYDAMTSKRSYRNALPQEVVRGEIEKGRGTQFDPEFADIMLSMIDDDKEYRMREIKKPAEEK